MSHRYVRYCTALTYTYLLTINNNDNIARSLGQSLSTSVCITHVCTYSVAIRNPIEPPLITTLLLTRINLKLISYSFGEQNKHTYGNSQTRLSVGAQAYDVLCKKNSRSLITVKIKVITWKNYTTTQLPTEIIMNCCKYCIAHSNFNLADPT